MIVTKQPDNKKVDLVQLKVGDYFVYSEQYGFDYVKETAEKNGFVIEYMRPKTEAYKKWGCFCCKVLEYHDTVNCKYCGQETRMKGTQLCNNCWEMDSRIRKSPAIALKILSDMLEGK